MALEWYAHDLEAYSRKTRGLTMQQDGAYRRLLSHYYQAEGPLPREIAEVHRIAGAMTKGERSDTTLVLKRFFDLREDGWHNPRADDELAAAREIISAKSEAGKAGAIARWNGKRKGKRNGTRMAPALADDMPTQRQTDAHLTTTDTGLETDVSKPKRASAPFVLPDWVPRKAWEAFIEVRKRARSNPTDHAKSLLVGKLEKLKEQGFSPQECIEAAIESGWKSFYPPKQNYANGRPSTAHENLQAGTLAALDRIAGRG